jgi:ASC-1-like (ASCH) protein
MDMIQIEKLENMYSDIGRAKTTLSSYRDVYKSLQEEGYGQEVVNIKSKISAAQKELDDLIVELISKNAVTIGQK